MYTRLIAPKEENEITKYWKFTDKVYVSCVCITFNQRQFIEQTIQGFLAQITDYRFEIVVHDDASTDSTRELLELYKSRYPGIIKLVLQDKNQHTLGKKITPIAISKAKGDYIALCEGDDYWISENKIQSQISLLKPNKDISLVHTKCYKEYFLNSTISESEVPKLKNDFESLLIRNGIQTPTTMFRRTEYNEYQKIFGDTSQNWKFGDLPFWLYLSTVGKIILLEEKSTLYRVLDESASHSNDSKKIQTFIKTGLDIRIYMAKFYLNSIGTAKDIECGLRHLVKKHIYSVVETDYEIETELLKYANLKTRFLAMLYIFLPTRKLSKFTLKLIYKLNWERF
ncbi:glycosyltransferase [Vibrio breoganii]